MHGRRGRSPSLLARMTGCQKRRSYSPHGVSRPTRVRSWSTAGNPRQTRRVKAASGIYSGHPQTCYWSVTIRLPPTCTCAPSRWQPGRDIKLSHNGRPRNQHPRAQTRSVVHRRQFGATRQGHLHMLGHRISRRSGLRQQRQHRRRKHPRPHDTCCRLANYLPQLAKDHVLPWSRLQVQFGSRFQRPDHFRMRFLENLDLAVAVYRDARIDIVSNTSLLWAKSSGSHLARINSII
jgi:hypothetical protein